uniref:Large ribosomal subunit protein eL24 n=1 Tax=Monodelphis domestica TaxID=13616 RepID=A0A5F8HJH1_MONDO
ESFPQSSLPLRHLPPASSHEVSKESRILIRVHPPPGGRRARRYGAFLPWTASVTDFPGFRFRVELCSFSGYKIYPGHGRRYARTDGKVFQFLNAKCESAFLSKRNPRQINWTVLYRRKHKKGQSEEIQKKRTRRAVKFQRAITGASLADIMAKRNQKPEVRKAQREQAIRAAKEAKKAKQATKKTAASAAKAPTKAAPKQKIVKPVKVSAPRVGGKR